MRIASPARQLRFLYGGVELESHRFVTSRTNSEVTRKLLVCDRRMFLELNGNEPPQTNSLLYNKPSGVCCAQEDSQDKPQSQTNSLRYIDRDADSSPAFDKGSG